MSEQDDERWITERDNEPGASFRTCMRAALARGYERGKAEGADSARGWTDALDAELTRVRNALTRFGVPDTAGEVPHHRAIQPAERVDMLGDDRDRLAKRCEYLDDVIGAMQNADVRDTDRLAALEQRVGELVEITRGCVDESIEEQDALARLAALRAPGMGSDVDVQRDRADRLAVLVDGLRGTLERTRAEIETLRARVGGARWLLATAHITKSLTPPEWHSKREAWLAGGHAAPIPDPARGLIERAVGALESVLESGTLDDPCWCGMAWREKHEHEHASYCAPARAAFADIRAYLGGGA